MLRSLFASMAFWAAVSACDNDGVVPFDRPLAESPPLDAVKDRTEAPIADATSGDRSHGMDAPIDGAWEAADAAWEAHVGDATTTDEGAAGDVVLGDLPAAAVQVVVSYTTACAVLIDGSLWCWGQNDWGDVGDGTREDRASPVQVLDRDVSRVVLQGPNCALRTNGDIYCWGNNSEGGVTGRPLDPPVVLRPTRVNGLPRALDVATSGWTNCVVAEDRRVWCWGSRAAALGPRPASFSDLRDVVRLSMTELMACALLANGRIRCWAGGRTNACGTRASRGACTSAFDPTYVDDIDDAVDVVVGADLACAIRRDRSLWCWGANGSRQLGALSSDLCACAPLSGERFEYPCSWSPQRVPLSGPVARVDVSDRYARVCAVLEDGTMWCWGEDESQTRKTGAWLACERGCFASRGPCRVGPAQVYGVADAVEVGLGYFGCIRRRAGEVRCWSGESTPSTLPTRWW